MKTLLSLALLSLLLNAMTICTPESRSSDTEKESPDLDENSFKVVQEYYPPGKEYVEDYTDGEKFVLYQMENGLANNCTIIDYNRRVKIVHIPRPPKYRNKDTSNVVDERRLTLVRQILLSHNASNESMDNQSSDGHYFTATSVSHANVPEYAKPSRSSSANGRNLEEAKCRAYDMLLSRLTNDYNQLYNYYKYCLKEIDFTAEILDKIYDYADAVEDNDASRYFYQINKLLEKWYDRKRNQKEFDDFKEDQDLHFLGNSIEREKEVRDKQKSIDGLLEINYENVNKMTAGERCIDRIATECRGSNSAASIKRYIIRWHSI